MCEDWGKEYNKLADLYAIKCKEVRELKDKNNQIRTEIIDEFAQAFKDYVYTEILRGNEPYWTIAIKKVSEQLKEQKND